MYWCTNCPKILPKIQFITAYCSCAWRIRCALMTLTESKLTVKAGDKLATNLAPNACLIFKRSVLICGFCFSSFNAIILVGFWSVKSVV